jgi:hypothetical protein
MTSPEGKGLKKVTIPSSPFCPNMLAVVSVYWDMKLNVLREQG